MGDSSQLSTIGMLLTIIACGLSILGYMAFFALGILFGILLIIAEAVEIILLLFSFPLGIAGAIVGGIGGFYAYTQESYKGAILSLIGTLIMLIFNIILYFSVAFLGFDLFTFILLVLVLLGIFGTIGSFMLVIALRKHSK